MLYAVTNLNSEDVRSLCSCTVCGRMSLLSVVCVCLEFLPGEIWSYSHSHLKIKIYRTIIFPVVLYG